MNIQEFALTTTRYICQTRKMQAIINDDPVFVVDDEGLMDIKEFVKGNLKELDFSENMKTSLYIDIINTVKAGDYLGHTIDDVEQMILRAIKNNQIESELH